MARVKDLSIPWDNADGLGVPKNDLSPDGFLSIIGFLDAFVYLQAIACDITLTNFSASIPDAVAVANSLCHGFVCLSSQPMSVLSSVFPFLVMGFS